MNALYHPSITPRSAVEGTLARWYSHYLRTNGHLPVPELTRAVRKRIEKIAHRRDVRAAH